MSLLQRELAGGTAQGALQGALAASTLRPAVQAKTGAQSVLPDPVRQRIIDELLLGLDRDWTKRLATEPQFVEQMRRRIEDLVDIHTRSHPTISKVEAVREIAQDILGYGPLQPLLDDPEVSEIMVNAPDDIWTERGGKLVHEDGVTFRSADHARNILAKILSPIGREISEANPMVNARLRDGSRVNAVIHPIALSGFALDIRKFTRAYSLDELIQMGTLDERIATLLQLAVAARVNLIVSGGTGSGKTTFLNVLSGFIPEGERIVTIEDTAELKMRQRHVVALEARPANMEGTGEVRIRDLVVNALRMRPDRIIVGEVRAAEALDMLQAMNTGHDGSLTTVHANSPSHLISRLDTMVLMAGEGLTLPAIRAQIAGSVDLVVQVSRLRDGTRRVTEVAEVLGLDGDQNVRMRPIFALHRGPMEGDRITGKFIAFGAIPKIVRTKLRWAGLEVPAGLFERDPEADAWSAPDEEEVG